MPRPPLRMVLWAAVVVVAWAAVLAAGVDPREVGGAGLRRVSGGRWLVPALLGTYALRGVVLFPATALTLFAGFALGPFQGALVAWLGTLLSTSVAYGLARAAAPGRAAAPPRGEAAPRAETGHRDDANDLGWRARLKRNAFEATVIARLASVPGDVVNLAAGAARAPFVPFLLATGLGGTPGLLAVVWAGASLEGVFEVRQISVRPELIIASLAMAVVTIGLSRWIRRRSGGVH